MSVQALEALLALVFLALVILGTWATYEACRSADRRVAVIVTRVRSV